MTHPGLVPCRQCSSEGTSAAPEPTLTSRRAVLVAAACASSAAGVGALLLGTRMLLDHGWQSRSHAPSAGACQTPGAAARLELYGDLGGFHHPILTDSAQAQSLFDLVREVMPAHSGSAKRGAMLALESVDAEAAAFKGPFHFTASRMHGSALSTSSGHTGSTS